MGHRRSSGEGVCISERIVGLDPSRGEDTFSCRQLRLKSLPKISYRFGRMVFSVKPAHHVEDLAQVDPADDRSLRFQQRSYNAGGGSGVLQMADDRP